MHQLPASLAVNSDRPAPPEFFDLRPESTAEQIDLVKRALLAQPAEIAPKYFYDRLGSTLFGAICLLDEYYPTRTEAALFERHGAAIGRAIGADACLIDLGAGDCGKAARLMPLLRPARYVAVDISTGFVRDALLALARQYPAVRMTGIGTDFSENVDFIGQINAPRRWFFYPGSSIGNFDPAQAREFLTRLRACIDPQGGLLIGIDLLKPTAVLEAAYDDPLGLTAAFNLNVLRHLNRLIDSNFDVAQWRHRAFFNSSQSRIEMHLEAREALVVRWPGGERHWLAGERIHTENSYKFTLAGFEALLAQAGFRLTNEWRDDQDWFALVLARPA